MKKYIAYCGLDCESCEARLATVNNDATLQEAYRLQGIAGRLLNMAMENMRTNGITPLYLVTDHTGFYERYGWEFLCMVQGDGEPEMTRMYIHR